jgi:hypothetical protein
MITEKFRFIVLYAERRVIVAIYAMRMVSGEIDPGPLKVSRR